MTDLSKEQQLAESAKQVLESEAFQKSQDAVNSLIVQAWIKTPPEAVEERERLYAQFHYGQNYVVRCKRQLLVTDQRRLKMSKIRHKHSTRIWETIR